MTQAKKVLMLVENLSVPGDPRVWHEACTLRENGFQVSIISPMGTTKDREAYTCLNGIHIYRYSLPTRTASPLNYLTEFSTAMLKTFWLSLKIWRLHDFDIIHAANPPDIFFALGLFYRLFGKIYVFDQHDLAPELFQVKFRRRMKPLHTLLLWLERCSYHTAQVVITTNESQRRCALQRGSCQRHKVVVVRNGPDLNRFTSTRPDISLKRGKSHLLVYVGVIGAQDGVEYLLYAINDLVRHHGRHDLMLAIIGDGDRLPLLKTLVRCLGIDEYVYFTGWIAQADMLRYLATADIGLSPDPSNELNNHSTMIKTMEYMAMGKPVVAFDLPETRYSAQESALYATPNNVAEFASHIAVLLDRPELRYRLGAQGRKRVEEVLCWERQQKKLLRAYKQLSSDSSPVLDITKDLPSLPTSIYK
ncbi:glycosyltransferase WbuB [Reticulibacter mediterranei]|uniref:Glycosyltransferase WbuB n=1 Tax=Reticulibacter mediterranei TaxID=2778369 RepID=A0A8J3IFR0_9CHLR|nr:glycosyltransferase family 4 protein [Reticulibacter mediterranei]GHO91685.1 glycosyltransferase WbuB [Reticulibacter mediterranei]